MDVRRWENYWQREYKSVNENGVSMTETANIKKQTRIEWIDTLKFIGIYTIYVAHFLEGAGNIYKFACMYVIQLFFFVSGCFAVRSIQKNSFKNYLMNQIKHLLIPYFLFGLCNIGIIAIQENRPILEILPLVKQMVFGIRNQLFAPALWFLPCLFIVALIYAMILKLVKKSWIAFLVGFIIYGCTMFLLPFDPTDTPKWFFNIDSALCYLLFYALGAFSFPWLSNICVEKWNAIRLKRKILISISGTLGMVIVLITTALTFFGRQDFFVIYPIFAMSPLTKWLYPIFIAVAIIIFHIVLAMWLQRLPLLSTLGKNTLAFCGNETMIKTLVPCFLSLIGVGIQIVTPLHAYLYGFLLLIITNYVMIPIEKKLFPKGMI